MSKKKETPAIKARKTKLNQKSTEELIQIILRKDAVERKNNEIIQGYKNDLEKVNKQILDEQADVKVYQEKIDKLNTYNDKLVVNYQNACDAFDALHKAHRRNKFLVVLGFGIAFIFGLWLLYFML